MRNPASTLAATAIIATILLFALAACGIGESESGEHREGSESAEHSGGESGERREGAESREGGEEGEESADQYARNETYDEIRAGARLIISYDANANAFTGAVENTTGETLNRVRVEVHLSNGVELGPTTPIDLAPGQTADVTLPASNERFETWSAHPEVG